MHVQPVLSGMVQALVIALGTLGATACSVAQPESFTLVTELPPGFSLKGEASYVPRTGETCTVPPREGKHFPGLKFFEQTFNKDAQTASFTVPLTDEAGGCPLVLRSFEYNLQGNYGPEPTNIGGDYASLSFHDQLPEGAAAFPSTGTQTLQSQCQWLFRTMGPYRYIVKILKCRATDVNGQMLDAMAGGALPRGALAGKTVNMVFTLSNKEQPFYKGWWIETPKGWKACTGLWGTPNEELCKAPYQFIESFKMPDGRDCSVYPNCTE